MKVRAKKHLGQHFLKDLSICSRIADALEFPGDYKKLLEIGPGTGALTQFLLPLSNVDLDVCEIDVESIAYLKQEYPVLQDSIIEESFLSFDFVGYTQGKPVGIIGNFPYNISSQILFKVYDHRNLVPEVVGMFQKEVAERVAEKPGSKRYGILSVLLQAYYDIEYLFTVSEDVFDPPPKVKSGVIRLKRNDVDQLGCDEKLFKTVVKTCFNQRRKTIRNALKGMLPKPIPEHELLGQRAEQLDVASFVDLTNWVEKVRPAT